MERTVPNTGSEAIELYMRTYYSLMRSTHQIQIESLIETHMAVDSSLHELSRSTKPDVAALIYASLRLPPCMTQVDFVMLGQLEKSFLNAGVSVTGWERVSAAGRRRRMHFDGVSRLAVFVASRSDIDDLIPILTAYQIEWNKLHALLQGEITKLFLAQHAGRQTALTEAERAMLAAALAIPADDLNRLELAWGTYFVATLQAMAESEKSLRVKQIAGSVADYRRATSHWWDDLMETVSDAVDLEDRPVYFVSSNTHCLPNLLTGFVLREDHALIEYIFAPGNEKLAQEYTAILQDTGKTSIHNFLYYILKKYLRDAGDAPHRLLEDMEREIGIKRVPSRHGSDVEAQVIELSKLRADWIDPRLLGGGDLTHLFGTDAVILNIDYPLGLGAYELLMRVTEQVTSLLGVYVMGKAATLNARIGDVMISNVVHDEHSQNTYLFANCFGAEDVVPFLSLGMALDNQKAISTRGTFLQNSRYMSVFYKEGYTVIEMEAGPYLSAVYETFRPQRHPQNEIVNLYGVPFEVGILHYASDTPLTKGKNLGSNLSYTGVDPTYATAIAILQRILQRERDRNGARLLTAQQNGLKSTEVLT
ncbi:MAG: hypothetical protein L6Q98_08635 [Anaerolineae bacterium]|nr:hypothetical protein [Anaerolineae bacterium]NUQ05009.1 hypothetical protein [Anaerolineae bacterium]